MVRKAVISSLHHYMYPLKNIIAVHHIMNRDTDGNGILKYAQTQVTNEALIVVDDYCIVAGTDRS